MRCEREARPLEDLPPPNELLYDIGMVLAVMLGVALLTNVVLGG